MNKENTELEGIQAKLKPHIQEEADRPHAPLTEADLQLPEGRGEDPIETEILKHLAQLA